MFWLLRKYIWKLLERPSNLAYGIKRCNCHLAVRVAAFYTGLTSRLRFLLGFTTFPQLKGEPKGRKSHFRICCSDCLFLRGLLCHLFTTGRGRAAVKENFWQREFLLQQHQMRYPFSGYSLIKHNQAFFTCSTENSFVMMVAFGVGWLGGSKQYFWGLQ